MMMGVGHQQIDLGLAEAARHIAVRPADLEEGTVAAAGLAAGTAVAAGPVEAGLRGRTEELPVTNI